MEDFKRIIKVEDEELLKFVTAKMALVEEGRELNEAAIELADQHSKLVEQIEEKAAAIREIQLQVIPLVEKLCEKDELLTEYEVPLTTDIKDDGLILEVEDQLKAFQAKFESINKFSGVPAVKDAKDEIKD